MFDKIRYNMLISSPSASYGGDLPGYSDPIAWLDAFFAACVGCKVDFITTHVSHIRGREGEERRGGKRREEEGGRRRGGGGGEEEERGGGEGERDTATQLRGSTLS
jgi:hypothetical protein